jgi:transcriptional regulator GlxA family with amidase domain
MRRAAARTRYAERAPAAVLGELPSSISPLLRRILHACVSAAPPETVDELASIISLPKRSLTRDVARRGWPAPHVLLKWGRLFRGAAAGAAARIEGTSWEEAQWVIAIEAGYGSVRTASRAYRARAGVSLREIWRDGAAALIPAFLSAIDEPRPHRLAS